MSGHHRTVLSYELDEFKCPRITWRALPQNYKGVQRLVSANPIYRRRYRYRVLVAPPLLVMSIVQAHAPPHQEMFRKQPLAVSSPPSAVAATANPAYPQPPPNTVPEAYIYCAETRVIVQSKPPNPETSLGSAQAHYYFTWELG